MDGGETKRGIAASHGTRRTHAAAQEEAETGRGGWFALMVSRGHIDPAMAWAALDIRSAQIDDALAPAGLRALDPGRPVVDGGRAPQSLHPAELRSGRVRLGSAARARWAAYAASLRQCGATLRGRRSALFLDRLLVRVLVDGISPRALDAELGVRTGRVAGVVLDELRRYAAHHRIAA